MNDRKRITSITTWIAGMVAVAVTLLLPLGYFAVSYQYLVGSLETEAEMTSRNITELINANPDLWHYEQVRLEELLAQRRRGGHKETVRILDRHNRLVAESGTAQKPPLIIRRFELLDAGESVGRVEIQRSLFPLLFQSGLAALLAIALGVVIFVALRILPLRAVALAEKSLRESEERYRQLVEQAPNAILVYGTELILYANSTALTLFGAETAGQLVGHPILSIAWPGSCEPAQALSAVDADRSNSHQELRLARFDGTPIDVAAVGTPIVYRGEPAIQVILHDITERKRLQDQLTDKVVQLEAALAKVNQLEGIIPICMYCKKIRDDRESWQQLEEYITRHSEAHFSHGICPECFKKESDAFMKECEEKEG